MKCIVALVLAAMVLITEGSLIPLILSGPAILPPGLAIPGATIIQSNPAAIPLAITAPAPAPIALDIAPAAPGAPALILAASALASASSVSATRGSLHVAPLPGHAISQQQLNLAPAPGTA